KPAVVSSAAPREETDLRPLPPGWRSYTSPEGLRYYVNSCSKETTWRRPSLSAEVPQRPLARQSSSPYANGCHSISRTSLTEAADVALRRPTMSKQNIFSSQSVISTCCRALPSESRSAPVDLGQRRLHANTHCQFWKGGLPRRLGALGPRIGETWTGIVLVRADGRRHVLFSKGENVVHVPVRACDGLLEQRRWMR
ncbi:Growth arrest-specific protein 7, partial [Dissostichus eleginoides]